MISTVPRIAIPEPTSTDAEYNQRSLPQYVRAIEAAGGIAVPIALGETPAAQEVILASCSGILLPGSPADVDPSRYGQEAIQECAAKDPAREATDDLLLEDAFAHAKPVLGICYGLQSLNVWRRGTLIQDLPHAPGGAAPDVMPVVNHQPGREVQNAHPVLVKPGSRLSHLVGINELEELRLSVNSSHHQAVECPGEQLMVAAISPVDGVVEALEGIDSRQFVVAVQWHPERTYEGSEASRALFAAFVEAARAWVPFRETTGVSRP
jgi:putative glutamine amidotransferase